MNASPITNGSEPLAITMGRGAAAGLVGTVVMTAFQKLVEMPLTGRPESYAPAQFAERLGIRKRRGRRRRQLNYGTHFALGAGWGLARGVAGRAGLSGPKAVGAVFGAMWPGDVILVAALGIDEPWRWSARDLTIDVVDKFVLAAATGLAFDRLAGSS